VNRRVANKLFFFLLLIIAECIFLYYGWDVFSIVTAIAIVGAHLTLPVEYCSATVLALLPIQGYFDFPSTDISIRFVSILVILTILRSLLSMGRFDRYIAINRYIAIKKINLIVLVFFACLVVLAIPKPDRATLKALHDWIYMFSVMYMVLLTIRDISTVRLMLMALAYGAGFQALIGLAEVVLGKDIVFSILESPLGEHIVAGHSLKLSLPENSYNWIAGDRILSFGTFINNIEFSGFLASGIVLMWLMSSSKQFVRYRSKLIAGVWFQVLLILFAGKGTGWLTLCLVSIATVFLGFAMRTKKTNLKIFSSKAVIVSLVLFPLVVFFLEFSDTMQFIQARTEYLWNKEVANIAPDSRVDTWRYYLTLFAERPILGWGMYSSNNIGVPRVRYTPTDGYVTTRMPPESSYVGILAETGLVGGCAFMMFIVFIFNKAVKALRNPVRDPIYKELLFILTLVSLALLFMNMTVFALPGDHSATILFALFGMIVWLCCIRQTDHRILIEQAQDYERT
jgi:O-antigen ligase